MKKFTHKDRQAGITLLLAVFIMAGLVLIAVTVSALAIQSIRNSRAVEFSEPAIGEAQSGAEEGLFQVKRSGTVPTCDTSDSTSGTKASDSASGSSVYSARAYCQEFGGATFDMTPNSPKTFYLYDPSAPNGVADGCGTGVPLLDLSEMVDGGYANLTISLPSTASHSLTVYVSTFDGRAAGNPTSYPGGWTIAPGASKTFTSFPGPDGTHTGCAYDNRLIVKMVYWLGGSGSEVATVSASTDKGLPSIATVDSTGCSQRGAGTGDVCTGNEVYKRKIDVTIPK